MHGRWSVSLLVILAGVAWWASHDAGTRPARGGKAAQAPRLPARTPVQADLARLPMSFEANRGQEDAEVKFRARGIGYDLYLTQSGAVMVFPPPGAASSPAGKGRAAVTARAQAERGAPDVLRMTLEGAHAEPFIAGEDKTPAVSHYLRGNDSAKWVRDIPHCGKVRYETVYPGIDLVYYGNQRRLEHDFIVSPGADPERIRVRYEGAQRLALDADGNLVLTLPGRELIQYAPVVYQMSAGGERVAVAGKYRLLGAETAGFELGAYDPAREVVIDPILAISTYLGGASSEFGGGLAVDAAGNICIGGSTFSTNFPTLNPLQPANAGNFDLFILKLNPAGTNLIFSTYLGGTLADTLDSVGVDGAGNIFVSGITASSNFPTANALDATLGGTDDGFVLKLNPAGSALIFSTYLGGSAFDQARGLFMGPDGTAYVTGNTDSTDFPLVNPAQVSPGGVTDAFVARIAADGSALLFSTFLGGMLFDEGIEIFVDPSGHAYVTGTTNSLDFPVLNPYQASRNGSSDQFFAKYDGTGVRQFASFLGGGMSEPGNFADIVVDASGNVIVTGSTTSPDFPLLNPLDNSLGGSQDAYIAKFNPAGSALIFSTYLGGSNFDDGKLLGVDPAGNIVMFGRTASSDFPTVSPTQPALNGVLDTTLTILDPSGTGLLFSTFLGGGLDDQAAALAVSPDGNKIYVTGDTFSTDFPTSNALQPAFGGSADAFFAMFSFNAAPVAMDDFFTVERNIPLTVSAASGVLANDTDANGDPLTVTLVSFPASGVLSLNSDGSFTYRPPQDFTGPTSFTYTAGDGSTSSGPATVNLTVVNPGDVPQAAITVDTPAGLAPLTVNFSGGDSTDPQNRALTSFTWIFGDGTSEVTTVPTTQHTYATTGIFLPSLTVRNDQGVSSRPAKTALNVGDGNTVDGDLFINKASLTINFKSHLAGENQDSFSISGTINPAGLPADPSASQLNLTLNGIPIVVSQGGGFSRAAGPSSKFVLRSNGAFNLTGKGLDLRESVNPKNADGTQDLNVNVRLGITNVPITTPNVQGVIQPQFKTKAGAASKGAFQFITRTTFTGFFKSLKTKAKEAKDGNGYSVTASGPILGEFNTAVVPTGPVTITIGDAGGGSGGAVITVPLASLAAKGAGAQSSFTYSEKLGAVPQLKKFAILNSKRGFTLQTNDLAGTGIPGSGSAQTAFSLPLTLSVPTATRVLQVTTTVEIQRKTGAKAWKR